MLALAIILVVISVAISIFLFLSGVKKGMNMTDEEWEEWEKKQEIKKQNRQQRKHRIVADADTWLTVEDTWTAGKGIGLMSDKKPMGWDNIGKLNHWDD